MQEIDKMPAVFYKKFKELGGVMPDGISVIEEEQRVPSNLVDAIRMSSEPNVIVSWQPNEKEASVYPLMQGIKELKEIAEKYKVSDKNIRIVFAFDN